jgi:hypothetical protein
VALLRFNLNLRQSRLESARGAVMAAALAYGAAGTDDDKAVRLWQIAVELKNLRDPEVADAYETQRLRIARGGQPAENANG